MAKLLGPSLSRIFVTGASGFIGSHLVDMLLGQGYHVTAYDNLSNGRREFIEHHFGQPNFRFVEADILDEDRLGEAMQGHDLVWHLAANTDIIGGVEQPRRDLRDCVMGTFNVLEVDAADGHPADHLLIDGRRLRRAVPRRGDLGIRRAAAGRLHLRGRQDRQRGVHLGLLQPLRPARLDVPVRQRHRRTDDPRRHLRLHPQAARNPEELLIRGDGRQEKNYFLVEECINGMGYAYRNIPMTAEKPCDIFNLGTDSVTRVVDIAAIIKEEMGLPEARIRIEGTKRAWPGDQPKVHITVDRMRELGWTARLTSDQAVRIAVRRMLGKEPAALAA